MLLLLRLLLLLLLMMMMIIIYVVTVLMCRYEYAEGVLTVHAEYTVDCAHSLCATRCLSSSCFSSSTSAFSSSSFLLSIPLPPSPSFSLFASFRFSASSLPPLDPVSCPPALSYTLLSPLFSSPHLREGLLETGRCTGPEIPIPTSVGLNF